MFGKNTFNRALKRNVTIFKRTLSLVKCLKVHLSLTKPILGRNDYLVKVMSQSCRTMPIVTTCMSWSRDRVTTDLQSQSKLLGRFCVFSSSQCWCTRFADWIAINNIGREKGSTGREKKGFALSVPTIFVWDCSSWKVVSRLDFNIIPLFSILLSFTWLNFCIFLLYHFLKGRCLFKYGSRNVLTGYWHVMVLKCKWGELLKSAKREIKSIAPVCQFILFSFFAWRNIVLGFKYKRLKTLRRRLMSILPIPPSPF